MPRIQQRLGAIAAPVTTAIVVTTTSGGTQHNTRTQSRCLHMPPQLKHRGEAATGGHNASHQKAEVGGHRARRVVSCGNSNSLWRNSAIAATTTQHSTPEYSNIAVRNDLLQEELRSKEAHHHRRAGLGRRPNRGPIDEEAGCIQDHVSKVGRTQPNWSNSSSISQSN